MAAVESQAHCNVIACSISKLGIQKRFETCMLNQKHAAGHAHCIHLEMRIFDKETGSKAVAVHTGRAAGAEPAEGRAGG